VLINPHAFSILILDRERKELAKEHERISQTTLGAFDEENYKAKEVIGERIDDINKTIDFLIITQNK